MLMRFGGNGRGGYSTRPSERKVTFSAAGGIGFHSLPPSIFVFYYSVFKL